MDARGPWRGHRAGRTVNALHFHEPAEGPRSARFVIAGAMLAAIAAREAKPSTLREVAELVPVPVRERLVPPAVLRVRPCKGPAILYCLHHRELFDVWIFWNPASYGDVHEEAVRNLEAHLTWLEPDRGPAGIARDVRLVELVGAFLTRHDDCPIRACRDSSAEYADVIGSGEQAWTVFCLSEDDPFWERACLAQFERCRREIHKLRHERADHWTSYDERLLRKMNLEKWRRDLRAEEKYVRKTGRIWPPHVPYGDVLGALRTLPLRQRTARVESV